MKCPRCGNEMELDAHRRYPIMMCYNCGYMEGRAVEEAEPEDTNFKHLSTLNFNECASFLAKGLKLDTEDIKVWLETTYEE